MSWSGWAISELVTENADIDARNEQIQEKPQSDGDDGEDSFVHWT